MKLVKKTVLPDGRVRMTVEVAAGDTLLHVKPGKHYRLGGQIEDVVAAHVLVESRPVYWCSVSQQWVPAT